MMNTEQKGKKEAGNKRKNDPKWKTKAIKQKQEKCKEGRKKN